jgi:mono/diheme cytochrome c family protein
MRGLVLLVVLSSTLASADDLFRDRVAPIFERRCLSCHNTSDRKGGLSLETEKGLETGGDSGPPIVAGEPEESHLLDLITPERGRAKMPKDADPLKEAEIAAIREWIASGAVWPKDHKLEAAKVASTDWWSLQPLVKPVPPKLPDNWGRNAIDAFIAAKHAELGLPHAAEADRRTLIRRLYFDLIGLPPTPEETEAFVADKRDDAYELLVDRLLESPHYGERWARHWLDVVHFGETHGYDKDKPRPFAWPYRDYVIRSLNADKPYGRFIEEQIAGDVLYPGTVDGVEALGFLSAGPWDFIGHAEVPESKIDGKVARHLDRDDMVTNTMATFNSLTVQCAQCHNHKFDPILQEDYYRLQAVFAAIDRTDKRYDADPAVAMRRGELVVLEQRLKQEQSAIELRIAERAGPKLKALDERIAELEKQARPGIFPAEFGYHSGIEPKADSLKWVQVDLKSSVALSRVVLRPCHDDFNSIGDGFGFPVRFKVELSDDPAFAGKPHVLLDRTAEDFANPKLKPVEVSVEKLAGRYLRVTATRLAPRLANDFILAIAELEAYDAERRNVARDAEVSSLDSIEAPPRWRRTNLVDGLYPGAASTTADDLALLRSQRERLVDATARPEERESLATIAAQLAEAGKQIAALPPQQTCYVGAVHFGSGTFEGTGARGGRPRPIFVLHRGNVTQPGKEVQPGALTTLPQLSGDFELPPHHGEGQRRAALARWLTQREHPLTWRSIVNRVWQYHFGRGIVETSNDFGRNGQLPTHPELLNYLAVEFRDGRQSLKQLHKLIVTSSTYRQASSLDAAAAVERATAIDAENRFLWRMNRRRLEAELVRDSVLQLAGKLDRRMYGPSFQDFVIEKPEHSPHYEYELHDPNDPKSHRRSIYRFLVRSQPQPLMASLDCADPSMQVDRRNESLSALQALALLNNGFMVTMSQHFGERIAKLPGTDVDRVARAFAEACGRSPTQKELAVLVAYAERHGWSNLCRLILNLNEFVFVD